MLLGFEIGQGWPEAEMHSCGSYFVSVPEQGFGKEQVRRIHVLPLRVLYTGNFKEQKQVTSRLFRILVRIQGALKSIM